MADIKSECPADIIGIRMLDLTLVAPPLRLAVVEPNLCGADIGRMMLDIGGVAEAPLGLGQSYGPGDG